MSDDDPEMDVDVEQPHVAHRPHGDRHWADIAIPAAALFVSFVSIYIAWHHGRVMQELVQQNERLVEANSLPYLQVYGSNGPNGAVSLSVANQGVGPAKIATAEVSVDGRPVQSKNELLTVCCGAANYSSVQSSTLLGRMIRPGDIVTYIDFLAGGPNREKAEAFDAARLSDRIETRLCYCSVFDDCWTVTSKDPSPVEAPECKPSTKMYRE